jgi:Na+-driven multidrug efflux pump
VGSKIIYLITGTLGVLSVAYNIIGADKIGKADFEGFKKLFQTMITLYVPLFVQDFFETTLFSSIIISIATKGGTYITAAYSLLETFGEIILLPTFAYATVATTLAIQYHSSSRKQQENR